MARIPVTDRPPAAARRAPRVAAALVLSAAVAALHWGLIGALPWTASGSRAASPSARAVPVRALDVVEPRTASTDDARDTLAAASPPAPAIRTDTTPVDRRVAAYPPHRVPQPPPATGPSDAAAAAVRREVAAAVLPAPPRDDAPMPADPPPVYATRAPASAALRYALQRGDARGEALLRWHHDGSTYELTLQAVLPQGATLDQRSQGGFDDAGLAPLRLADRRRGRSAQAVNFQRPQGRITFSGPRWEYPLVPGVQDRLSWLVQLVAIASAQPLSPGDEVALQVVGARGATSRWRFRVDREDLPMAGVLRLVREPEHLYDLRVEVWLDPARGHWPARLRQAQVPGGETLEWVLEDGPTPAGGT